MKIEMSTSGGGVFPEVSIKGQFDDVTTMTLNGKTSELKSCLLYTSDAADERSSVDLGGRRIIKKKKKINLKW